MSNLWGGHDGSGHKIGVIATLRAKAGSEAELRQAMAALVDPSQDEPGCSIYHVLEDKYQPGLFFTYEEWESEEALEHHLEMKKQALEKAKHLVQGELQISVLELVK
jgi:quinol monooxygenase YgiN